MEKPDTTPPVDTNRIIEERRAKLAELRKKGPAFPNNFSRLHLAEVLAAEHEDKDPKALVEKIIAVSVAGRIMLKRVMGKACFATIQDMSGRIQLYVSVDDVGSAALEDFKHYDIGDIVGAQGGLFKTQKGELTVRVSSIRLLTKSLRPLPEKFHGLTDQEQKYRQRHVDLIMNEDTRLVFVQRARIIQAIRDLLIARRYYEAETPMMQPIPGGASARPFVTHHNALDMQLYLRIAPELYLKRLVVGGFEKVFEINRNFRNEGMSTRHNPEFTMLEFYAAYTNHEYLMVFIEQILRTAAQAACGTEQITYQGRPLDLSKPFARLTIADAIKKYRPDIGDDVLTDRTRIVAKLMELKIPFREKDGLGGLQLTLFENTVEAELFEPTYIVDYPAEVSPLARRSDQNPDITERFELYIAGREIANGFSELNDPEDQAERFREQVRQKDAGGH